MSKLELVKRVEESLEGIRPFLNNDGGDISIVDITDDNKVLVELHGACVSCNMSAMTMRAGVEGAIKSAVPEITSVEAVNLS